MSRASRVYLGIILFFCSSLFVILGSFNFSSNFLFTLVLILWIGFFSYSIADIYKHIVLFCFLVSFFVFLIGRELVFAYFGLDRYYLYLDEYNNITYLLMGVSMICVMKGYNLADKYKICIGRKKVYIVKRNNAFRRDNPYNTGLYVNTSIKRVRKVSKIIYYFCLLFSLINIIRYLLLVRRVGYLGTYINTNVSTPTIVGYFSSFTIMSLSVFLATKPSKKSSLTSLFFYELYGIFTMLTGHRYTFVAISMYFITYIVYRHNREGKWLSKNIVLSIIIAIPFVIMLMNVINSLRTGGNNDYENERNTIINFLDQQGGSVNVIKRIFYYKNQLSDMILTSFSNTRTVLFENGIIRKLFGIKVYSGNSIDNALKGHFLSHRLSYYEYGNYYLSGHGVGSCYIAELFHDFGFFGVIGGNLFYGYIIRNVTNIENGHFFRNGLFLATQYYLYLAPRGDFDGMIGGLLNVTSILGLLGIWILSSFFKGHRK